MALIPSNQTSITPYALSAVAMMLILSGDILTPDFLNYSLRVEELKNAQKAAPILSPPTSDSTSPVSASPPTTPVTSVTTDEKKVALDSSQIFETYGKVVTMLLGFVSILGVFVGYFVRKSLREIQKDIYHDVEKRMKLWEEQKDMLLESVKETRSKFEGLTGLYTECKQVLDTLKVAANAELAPRTPPAASTASVADSLDADTTLEAPQNVTTK